MAQGKFLAFPLAAPAYTPELGPTLVGAVMMSFKTNPSDTIIQRSSIPINIGVSTRGSYFFNTIISTYWYEDKLRIFGELRFRNTPDHYWGVGYDKAISYPDRDESNAYIRSHWKINPQILWQFKDDFFLGLNIDYNRTKASDVNPEMETDPDFVKYGPDNFNSGLGLILRYDSRDVPVNAWTGTLIDIQATSFTPLLGGGNAFNVLQLDIRKFLKIIRPGSTLALQIKSKLCGGDAPYPELAYLGSPYDLRGYYLGHFRDRSMILGLAEYRHQFMRSDGSLSRHGAVAWIGTGSIGPKASTLNKWLPNAGFGYRFEVQPRMNVRAEIGFGKNTRGFYFSFNEAF